MSAQGEALLHFQASAFPDEGPQAVANFCLVPGHSSTHRNATQQEAEATGKPGCGDDRQEKWDTARGTPSPIRKRSLQGAAPQCRNEAILMPPHGKEPPVRTSGPEGVFPGVIKELEVEG